MHRVLVDRRAIISLFKRDEFLEYSFMAHSHSFAQALRRDVVVLHVGIEPARILYHEEKSKQRNRCFSCETSATVLRIEVPPDGVRIVFRRSKKIADKRFRIPRANSNVFVAPTPLRCLGSGVV